MLLPTKNEHKLFRNLFIGFLILTNVAFWLNYKNVSVASVEQNLNIAPEIEHIEIYNYEPKIKGLLMFRGNPFRNYYGTGPINQTAPEITWRYPNEKTPKNKPLCAISYVSGVAKSWCGSGWTGQPIVWERPDGITEVITNAYDKGIHFINALDGTQTREPFYTNDIIKGTVTLDPDGYPLLYSGSRDNFYRIIALDRQVPTELWKIEAKISDGVWNDDWDPNGIIINDILYTGSENGWFHAIKLNRRYDVFNKVTVNPIEIFKYPTYADGYIDKVGDDDLSIESSPLLVGNVVYVANSGGRILGFDISKIEDLNNAPIVFDFWTGDDTDATLVADSEGYIYAASELERKNARSEINGQLMKLDPKKYIDNKEPLIWGIKIPGTKNLDGGIWSTPAILGNRLYVSTNPGYVMIIDTKNGTILDQKYIGDHAWSSPNLIENSLIIASCRGIVYNFDISNDKLQEIWQKQIPGGSCIESTPAIWNGQIIFGSRDGYIYSIK